MSFTVPQPMVEIGATQSDTYLAGMPFDLQCSITLDSTADTAVGATVTWQINGADLTDTVRVTASQLEQPALSGEYNAVLKFDTLSTNADSGIYVCSAILYPIESGDYILNSTRTSTMPYSITVVGM